MPEQKKPPAENRKRARIFEEKLSPSQRARLLKELDHWTGESTTEAMQESLAWRCGQSSRRYQGREASADVERATTYPNEPTKSKYVDKLQSNITDAMYAIISDALDSGTNLIECVPKKPGQEEQARLAQIALKQIILGSPHNREVIKDFLKNGIMFPISVASVRLFARPKKKKNYENLSSIQVALIQQNKYVSIVDMVVEQGHPTEEYPDGKRYVLQTEEEVDDEIVIETIPAEELLFPSATETLNQSSQRGPTYIGWKQSMRLEQAIRLYPHQANLILRHAKDLGFKIDTGPYAQPLGEESQQDDALTTNEGYVERHASDSIESGYYGEGKEIIIRTEYIWFHLTDKITKLLNVVRVGEKGLIHVCEVDSNSMAHWCSFKIPNRAIGLSIDDKVGQLTDILTGMKRNFMYVSAAQFFPKIVFNKSALAPADVATAFRSNAPGATQPVLGDPNKAFTVIPVDPNLAGSTWQMASIIAEGAANDVGLSGAVSGGLSDQGPGRSGAGMKLAQTRGLVNFKPIANNFGGGLEMLLRHCLRLMIDKGGAPISVRTEEGFVELDPSTLDADMDIRIRLGEALQEKAERLQNLYSLYGVVKDIISSPYLPIFMGAKELINVVRRLVEAHDDRWVDEFVKPYTEESEEMLQQILQAAAEQQEDNSDKVKLAVAQLNADTELKKAEMAREGESEQIAANYEGVLRKIAMEYRAKVLKLAADTENEELKLWVEKHLSEAELEVQLQIERLRLSAAQARGSGTASKTPGTPPSSGKAKTRLGGDRA